MEKLEINCPICNKSGLPDYKTIPTICPQCNSDLKGFLLIENAIKEKKTTFRKGVFISASIFIVILIVSYFLIPINRNRQINDVNLTSDSVSILKDRLLIMQNKISIKQDKVLFRYIVKKGDNLSKIAYSFYNDWSMYKQIMVDNKIKDGAILMPNDTLVINLKFK